VKVKGMLRGLVERKYEKDVESLYICFRKWNDANIQWKEEQEKMNLAKMHNELTLILKSMGNWKRETVVSQFVKRTVDILQDFEQKSTRYLLHTSMHSIVKNVENKKKVIKAMRNVRLFHLRTSKVFQKLNSKIYFEEFCSKFEQKVRL
jgi:hypothetical protein